MSQEKTKKKDRRSPDPTNWIRRKLGWYRGREHSFDFRPGPDFFALADAVVRKKRTRLGYDRLYVLWQAVRNVAHLPGATAEIGTYRGGSAYFLASAFVQLTGDEAPVIVFDTFEGHPAQSITDHDVFHTAGDFAKTSYEEVVTYLSPFRQVRVYKGDVSSTLPTLEEAAYRLVHIDTDLYQPTLHCLHYFGARMPAGGIVVVDDYTSRKCPGIPRAVSEYMAGANSFQTWDTRTEQLVLVKR